MCLGRRSGGPRHGFLVALALPVAGGRRRPRTEVRHAVVVDVHVALRAGVVVVDAPPPVDAAVQLLCDPAVLAVLDLAGDGQVTLIQLAGVAGRVRGRRREQASDDHRARRCGGREFLLETHFEPLSTRNAREFP